jgi:RNA 2',3'-cyclic 3'-phosphodiesterase
MRGNSPVSPHIIRAFFGLPLPGSLREELGGYISDCAAIAPDFRWTPASNLHLTVRFIGSVEREVVDDVARRLGELNLHGFDIELGNVGVFTRGRRVRVVWIGLRDGTFPHSAEGGEGAPAPDTSPPPLGSPRGTRGSWSQGRMGSLAPNSADGAVALAAQVEAECGRAGLAPEARPFQPHLTLARARDRDGSALPPLPPLPALSPWRASELVLYSSHLGRLAAVYEPLQTLALN